MLVSEQAFMESPVLECDRDVIDPGLVPRRREVASGWVQCQLGGTCGLHIIIRRGMVST
jgi:hypothetical protein